MNIKKFIYGWFGYSRSERVGSLVLIIFVVTIIVFRLIPDSGDQSLVYPGEPAGEDTNAPDSSGLAQLFYFDPNTVTRLELLELGLSERQANTLINYRNSGACFDEADDFRKVYGIPQGRQDSLIPYIVIERQKPERDFVSEVPVRKNHVKAIELSSPIELFEPIDINSSDSLQLMTIPGIGRVLGPRIVKYRNLLGGYKSILQLTEVYGIDSLKLAMINDYIFLDTLLIQKINLNTASYGELIRHPYITKDNTEAILQYRRLAGSILSFSDLLRNKVLSAEDIDRLTIYISIDDSVNIAR